MNKRSGHKRSGLRRAAKKGHKRTERKGKKSTRGYRKGSKSKTMKGKKDFTTKKSSKVFNRRGHYQKHAKGSRVIRRPYHKKGGTTHHNKSTSLSPAKLHESEGHSVPRGTGAARGSHTGRVGAAHADLARVDAAKQPWHYNYGNVMADPFRIPSFGETPAAHNLKSTWNAIVKVLKDHPVQFGKGKNCVKNALGNCLTETIIPEDYGQKTKQHEIESGQLGNSPSQVQ